MLTKTDTNFGGRAYKCLQTIFDEQQNRNLDDAYNSYGYDTAYCLKSHCGVSFFVPKTLLLHKNMCDKMIVSRFASKKMHKVLLVADLRNF